MNGYPERPAGPYKVGISRCLLGHAVRYDGTDAAQDLTAELSDGRYRFLDLCPEVAIGLGVPRGPIRLVGTVDDYGVRGVTEPSLDVTQQLEDYASSAPGIDDLDGYIFMDRSPSCGVAGVKLYPELDGGGLGEPTRAGVGVFARGVIARAPLLPVSDASALVHEGTRRQFELRVATHAHWRALCAARTAANLIEFHSRYKYLIMAHSQRAYREMGRLLADLSGSLLLADKAEAYAVALMAALREPPVRGAHVNVLQHLAGYFKQHASKAERSALATCIAGIADGTAATAEAIRMLRALATAYEQDYVARQIYLQVAW